MKIETLLLIGVAVYAVHRFNQSHRGVSAIDRVYGSEAHNLTLMNGTNFTNSYWDSASGQPGYMFGSLNVPGGTAVTPVGAYGSIVGHM